jgi:translation initiation factor 3 subunit H
LTKAFLDAHKKSDFGTPSLNAHRLTFNSILQEVPLKIRTNALLSAFLQTLSQPTPVPVAASVSAPTPSNAPLPPSFSNLDLGTASLSRNLEQLIEVVDSSRSEEGNLGYLSRQIGRERARADAYLAKRREENAVRVAQGLAPLPEEDVSRMFKIPAEPSRLEGMLLLGQVDAQAKSLETSASMGLVKMYAAKASAGV